MSEPRTSREKKAMDRFAPPAAKEAGDKHAIYEGSGTKLGDIPIVPVMLAKVGDADHDLLKAFHSFLYGAVGKKTVRKKNIRSFSGFPEDDDKEARKNKLTQSKKWTMPSLRDLCQLLGLDKTGDKSEVVDRLVDFLASPDPSASKGPAAKKPKAAAKKRKSTGKGKTAKKAKKVKKAAKPKPSSGYIMFVKETRPKVVKGNSDLKPTEIMAKMGEMWQACTDAQKEKYKKKGIKEFEKAQAAKAAKEEEDAEEGDEDEGEEEEGGESGDEDGEDDEE